MPNFKTLLLFFTMLLPLWSLATHNRAGEITYRHLGGFQYEATIITYTKSDSPADRPELGISWGDGSVDTIPRINGSGQGVIVAGTIKRNVYVGVHTFPGPSVYTLSFEDPNRNAGVVNIPNSVNIPFYVSTQLVINPFLGINNSVQLLNPPIDEACPGQIFIHNAGAFDPDGDSISYRLVECRGEDGLIIPGFGQPQASSFFSIDPITGDLVWDSPLPNGLGEYNVAFIIEEWRQGILIGSVTRDMQINVVPCTNIPPEISELPDVCLDAGTEISLIVTATNPDNAPPQSLTLSATGGPFSFPMPWQAEFVTATSSTGFVSQQFSWATDCSHVRKQPYVFSFKAIDNGNPNLATYKSMRIEVVAPAPENLIAEIVAQGVQLSWDLSPCNQASGYALYRKAGAFPFEPGPCETGVPAYTGYELLSTIDGYASTTYLDLTQGLLPGNSYCYRVIAVFADGAESYTSEEICVQLTETLPVLTNVSIRETDVQTGSVFVAWSKPDDLDTNSYPGPYFYSIERKNQDNGVFEEIAFQKGLNDSTYIDSSGALDTRNFKKTYRISLFAGDLGSEILVGSGAEAESVFLNTSSSDNTITLNWDEQVPWNNTSYIVYRRSPGMIDFDSIGVALVKAFSDTGLANGVEYCYRIKSVGAYAALGFVNPIENWSQEVCNTAQDLEAPCIPLAEISVSCDSLNSTINWMLDSSACYEDVVSFRIRFIPAGKSDTILIAEVTTNDPSSFIHEPGESLAGCYFLTAIDSFMNESNAIELCADNCPVYDLPNTFSPNGDGINDFYGPFPYAFIESVDFKVFNRWGLELFQTNEKDIQWDGKINGETLPDGVYYYICIVNEIRLEGIVPRKLTGTIQLFGVSQNKGN